MRVESVRLTAGVVTDSVSHGLVTSCIVPRQDRTIDHLVRHSQRWPTLWSFPVAQALPRLTTSQTTTTTTTTTTKTTKTKTKQQQQNNNNSGVEGSRLEA